MTVIAERPATLVRDIAARLRERRDELRALLHETCEVVPESAPDILDFKDVAAGDHQALIDEVACAHAADELAQVVAALHRIDHGTYGDCMECGEPIAAARLRALPATAYCTDCQTMHERAGFARR